MKGISLFFLFVISFLLFAGCRDFKRHVKSIVTYPTTAEEVADVAELNNSDAALVVTVADTQYVLYRKNAGERCYAMRYVSKHRCKHDFSGRGGTFTLDEPEQLVMLTHIANNALTLSVDSLMISVTDIVTTDSLVTFRFGIDQPDCEATLHLYGKARGTKDVFAETSIQQMLVLSLSLDAVLEDMDEEMDGELAEAELALDDVQSELDQTMASLDSAMVTGDGSIGCNARFARIDSVAHKLGSVRTEIQHRPGHHGCFFKATYGNHSIGGGKKCRQRMGKMQELAAQEHLACTVKVEQGHRNCSFECHN